MSPAIVLDTRPMPEVACNSLIQTDNKLFNKVIMVFAFLCDEVALDAAARVSAPDPGPTAARRAAHARRHLTPHAAEQVAAAALPVLLAVHQFVGRANSLTINLVHQLASLYDVKQRLFAATFRAVTMRRAFDALGEVLGLLIAIDDAIARASHLPEAMLAYQRVVANMQVEPERYGVPVASLRELEQRLASLELHVLKGASFRHAITQPFDVPGQLDVSGNANFVAQLGENTKRLLTELGMGIGQATELDQRAELPALVGLFCFYQYLSASPPKASSSSRGPDVDKKLYGAVWGLCKRVPLVYLGGVAMWRPLEFLARSVPLKSRDFSLEAAIRAQSDHLKQLDADLGRDLALYRLALCRWLPRFDSDLTNHPKKGDVLGATTSLLIQAVVLGASLGRLLRQFVAGHFELNKPCSSAQLAHVLGVIELLKAAQSTIDARGGVVASTAMHATRLVCAQLRALLLPVRAKLEAARASTTPPSTASPRWASSCTR